MSKKTFSNMLVGGILSLLVIVLAASSVLAEGPYYATKEEAVSHVPTFIVPKDCFVWKDGPDPSKPWRVIEGTGCAHWVAHELVLGTFPSPWLRWEMGEIEPPLPEEAWDVCYDGFYINVGNVIQGRKEVEIKDAKVGDIWTRSDLGHCGIVRQVGSGQVLIEHCSDIAGGLIEEWVTSGKCWRIYAVSITPLSFVGMQEQEVNCGATEDGGGSVYVSQQQWAEGEGDSWVFWMYQDFYVGITLDEVLVHGWQELFGDSENLALFSSGGTYAIENWSWYSMSEGTQHAYGEFQITSDTPWQLDIEFSGEKYGGSTLSMNASIYDSDWNLVQNVGRSVSWDSDWSGPEYDSAVFPTGTYYLTLDVQTQTQVSVSGPPEPGEEPQRVESFAKGQISADVTAWPKPESDLDLYWLAKAIMNEADGKMSIEQEAVGWTVLNRLSQPWRFGYSIREVVLDGYEPYWTEPHKEPNDAMVELAEDLLEGNIPDPTDGATHFFSPISMTSGYGPYKIPGTNEYGLIPNWVIPIGYTEQSPPPSDWVMLPLYKTIDWPTTEWIGSLDQPGRNYYFMFYRPWMQQILASIQSPGELRAYDSEGRVTGVVNGTVVSEIPGSEYLNNTIVINFPDDYYLYEVAGTSDGVYGLTVTAVTKHEDITFVATGIPTSGNAVHEYEIDWEGVSAGEEGVLLQVDSDGDGTFEQTISTGATLQAPANLDEYTETTLGRVGYDRRTRQFSVNATVTNTSSTAIGSPVWLVIESISNMSVTLANSDGTSIDGKEYIDLSGLLGNGQLDPGESVRTRVYFNNPTRVRFNFTSSVRGIILP